MESLSKVLVSEEELAQLCQPLQGWWWCRSRYRSRREGVKVVGAIYNGAPIVTTSIQSRGIPSRTPVLEIEDQAELFAGKTIKLYQDNERLNQLCPRTEDYIKKHYSLDRGLEGGGGRLR